MYWLRSSDYGIIIALLEEITNCALDQHEISDSGVEEERCCNCLL